MFWIGIVALVAVSYAVRPAVARKWPWLPAYYSFDQGLFTYERAYSNGGIGPFSIGATKDDTLLALSAYGRPFRVPMAMNDALREELYFSLVPTVTPTARNFLRGSDSWRIALHERGASIIYQIDFQTDRSTKVTVLSTLMT